MPKATAPKPSIAKGELHFSSVKKARAALMARAEELLDKYLKIIDQAAAAGDFETAAKHMQHLMDHMPTDEGTRLIDQSVDKQQQVELGPKGPTIQIVGINMGGIAGNKQLPSPIEVIDVKPV